MSKPNVPPWLRTAIFYEIYPQSFCDSNADGIGDLPGIINKLDYVKELGCNAIWLNPVYDSPFKDGGYDVRDYVKIAQRYGSNEDMYRLIEEAHKKGIRVVMDLIPGHTSEEHDWFIESRKAEHNEFSDRYVWTDCWFSRIDGYPFIGGEAPRDGVYMLNFFKCQPALNYGWLHPTLGWQKSMDSPEARATIEAIKDIMRFWLDHGADGFRVDMADSLVKRDDVNKSGTCRIWHEIREMLDQEYPDAVLISEWSNPEQALNGAGFHADFYLDHWGNGYNTLVRDNETEGGDHSFFKKDAGGDIMRFLKDYLPKYEASKEDGYISFITGNHDCPRTSRTLTITEQKLAFAFLMTMPGVPFLYYGDEIGMRYIEDLPTVEGGYTRTGTRTPMQWDQRVNFGFSEADPADLYIPVDPSADAPTVSLQQNDPTSLWSVVHAIFALRSREADLQADADFSVLYAQEESYPFVYRRGELVLAVNPSGKEQAATVDFDLEKYEVLYSIGEARLSGEKVVMGPQSFAIFN